MIILGIETSCDETACALVEDGVKILSSNVASSSEIHKKTGGIIPEQAARAQLQSMIAILNSTLSGSSDIKKLDAIAVTTGPGLIGSLLVGVESAKTLAYLWEKPIVPVNHLLGHIYANWIQKYNLNKKDNNSFKPPDFPALALVVSGGHTDLVLMKNHGSIKWIGGTRDDAAGEAYDKTARLLGLPYPGGPSIAKKSNEFLKNSENKKEINNIFPRAMINLNNYDFSFSGLKTSVLRKVDKIKSTNKLDDNTVEYLSAEIQEAINEALVKKTLKAVEHYKPKSFLLSGGVAANINLRNKFETEIKIMKLKIDFRTPPPALCTDNAAYIASCAFFNYSPVPWKNVAANPQLTITDKIS